jgi:L-ascorbate metabolism protein UlaG (beta-lactamase superfamily)
MSGNEAEVALRYLGGPTALLELGGLRLLTDPTFDPPGGYPVGNRVLRKTIGALVPPDQVGPVDAVLLSHDQHPDNLDGQGRGYLGSAPLVLSTAAARQRLGGTVRALENWQHVELPRAGGAPLRVTGVPARHGPPGCEPVTARSPGSCSPAMACPPCMSAATTRPWSMPAPSRTGSARSILRSCSPGRPAPPCSTAPT